MPKKNKKLCKNCFSHMSGKKCSACGYTDKQRDGSGLFLQRGTKLNGSFIIGGVIGSGGFGVTYMAYAVKMNMLTDNPCRNVTVPKGETKEKNIYTVEELAEIFELLDGEDVPTKYRVFIKLAVYSGFRRGELLGLEWKDIDWENNLISVRRTSNYTVEHGTYTDTTKTKKSKRTLRFPDHVMDMLRDFKEEQDKERDMLGNKWTDTDRLFTQWDGSPMGNCTPYSWFRKFCKRNNIRFCDLHSLRHHNNMKTHLSNFEVYKQIYLPANNIMLKYNDINNSRN